MERHLKHARAVAVLGRSLTRRAGSRCELCTAGGVPLAPWEVPPVPAEPEPDRALLLCGSCLEGVEGGDLDPQTWHFLEAAAWSEVPAVQVTVVRLLRRLAAGGAAWATDLLDGLWLGPEVVDWLEGG